MHLLYIAGFKKSNNNTRLIWKNTNDNIKTLTNIYQTLQSIMNTQTMRSEYDKKQVAMTRSETFDELIDLGFTEEEASNAISMSTDIHLPHSTIISNQVSFQCVFFFVSFPNRVQ